MARQTAATRARTLLWVYRQYIGMSYIALALQAWIYIAIYWTRSVDLDPAQQLWKLLGKRCQMGHDFMFFTLYKSITKHFTFTFSILYLSATDSVP